MPQRFRCRLVHGLHIQNNKTYRPGAIVESDEDLVVKYPEKFSRTDLGSDSFDTELAIRPGETIQQFADRMSRLASSRAGDNTPLQGQLPSSTSPEDYRKHLQTLSVEELQAKAADDEVDTTGYSTKDELVACLMQPYEE